MHYVGFSATFFGVVGSTLPFNLVYILFLFLISLKCIPLVVPARTDAQKGA